MRKRGAADQEMKMDKAGWTANIPDVRLYTASQVQAMRQPPILCGVLLLAFCAHALRVGSQTNTGDAQSAEAYRLRVAVEEVVVTFHAADAHGLSVNDLRLDEIELLDNGKPPAPVFDFRVMENFPVHAGILVDASESMQGHLSIARAIANEYAQRLLRQQGDQAFVADFVRRERIVQPWTSDPALVSAGIRKVSAGAGSLSHGTAILDTVSHACVSQFGEVNRAVSGNFILLFSDGEDNASDTSLQEAVDACQRSNTAIYAFRAEAEPGLSSPGPKMLAELTAQTGGRVFRDNSSDAEIYEDLRAIEASMRNQYRIAYRPAELKHDGSFHHIVLVGPERVDQVTVRSGYYAPAQ
jgi:VWFA-related protein